MGKKIRLFKANALPPVVVDEANRICEIDDFVVAWYACEDSGLDPESALAAFEETDEYDFEDGVFVDFKDGVFELWIAQKARAILEDVYEDAIHEEYEFFFNNPSSNVREFLWQSKEFRRRKLPASILNVL